MFQTIHKKTNPGWEDGSTDKGLVLQALAAEFDSAVPMFKKKKKRHGNMCL